MSSQNLSERVQAEIAKVGGKGFHLGLLKRGGFRVPETRIVRSHTDIEEIPKGNYVVRSSAAFEDSSSTTGAGKFTTLHNVTRDGLAEAVKEVLAKYNKEGSAVIQPDLTARMQYSGVIYTNLSGELVISMGRGSGVQSIVEGGAPETEITIFNDRYALKGKPVNPKIIESLHQKGLEVENYLGIPTDIEFAVVDGEIMLLQARPLPNPTDNALKEHELRRVKRAMAPLKRAGLEETVLSVGNYREILGDDKATKLSTTIFNYVFSGDGEKFGGQQLGRREIGYDLGNEIYPWVVMVGGKVYFNFAGDALQFRPKGISITDLLRVINGVYIPVARASPEVLDYPELQLYVQFPDQAEAVGLDSRAYRALAESNRERIKRAENPTSIPKKVVAKRHTEAQSCLQNIYEVIDGIREGSAKSYSQAARLGFFALENLRNHLERLHSENLTVFMELASLYDKESPLELRDVIAYDESIESFEVPTTEEYRYLGSFEISQERGFPPERKFKAGREIPHIETAEITSETRRILGYREKVKFYLFRDYDHLKQLVEQLGELTGLGADVYHIDFKDLGLLIDEPSLALYRIEFQKEMKSRDLFGEGPIFESQVSQKGSTRCNNQPRLIFGSLSDEVTSIKIGNQGYVVNAVDQTVSIPEGTEVVLVPSNVRPGSHLFTVLSDYRLPVVAVPNSDLRRLERGQQLVIRKEDKGIQIDYNTGDQSV